VSAPALPDAVDVVVVGAGLAGAAAAVTAAEAGRTVALLEKCGSPGGLKTIDRASHSCSRLRVRSA